METFFAPGSILGLFKFENRNPLQFYFGCFKTMKFLAEYPIFVTVATSNRKNQCVKLISRFGKQFSSVKIHKRIL